MDESVIGTEKIINAIAIKLNSLYPNATIYTNSVPQNFNTPAFFIKLLKSPVKKQLGNRYFKEHAFAIYYYASADEKFVVADNLTLELELIEFEDSLIRGTNINYRPVDDDTVLFFINYNLYLYKQTNETSEKMETLEIEK